MSRLKAAVVNLVYGFLAFSGATTMVYLVLWHYSGMDKVQPNDNPGVVLGAFWCFGWAIMAGALVGVTTLVYRAFRQHRRSRFSN
jgi:hypothetical protein